MGKRTWIAVLSVVAAVAALGVAWTAHRAAQAGDRGRRALVAERSRLEGQMKKWELEATMARKRTGEIGGTLTRAPAEKEREIDRVKRLATGYAGRVKDDPEGQARYLAMRRAELAVSYGPFVHRLKLNAAQREELMGAICELEATEFDLRVLRAAADGGEIDKSAHAGLRDQAAAAMREKQSVVLGPERFRQLQEYERTRAGRDIVGGLAGCAAVMGTPVTPSQAEELTQALAEGSSKYLAGGNVEPNWVDWKAVDARAAKILSPEQMRLWTETDVTPRWRIASSLALKRAMDIQYPPKKP